MRPGTQLFLRLGVVLAELVGVVLAEPELDTTGTLVMEGTLLCGLALLTLGLPAELVSPAWSPEANGMASPDIGRGSLGDSLTSSS